MNPQSARKIMSDTIELKQWLLMSDSAFDKFNAFIDTCAPTRT